MALPTTVDGAIGLSILVDSDVLGHAPELNVLFFACIWLWLKLN